MIKHSKVGIVTIQSMNYGNRLQNYALQETINSLGYEVETIQRSVPLNGFKNLKRKMKATAMHVLGTKGYCFHSFDKHIKFSRYYALSDDAQEGLSDEFDFFVTGSDQVWNPYYSFVGKTDLLCFARHEQKISFGASFGVDHLPKEKQLIFKNALVDFSSISVREAEGARIIKELTGRDATVVLDPTLLLDNKKWETVSRKPNFLPEGEYTLVYALGAKNKSFELEVKGENVFDIRKIIRGREIAVGPAEFLYLINHAKRVLTDSFHATVFSAIFCRPCMTFKRPGIDMSSRIASFAKSVGLENQFDENGTFIMDRIDKNVLEDNKEKSIEFIKKALS